MTSSRSSPLFTQRKFRTILTVSSERLNRFYAARKKQGLLLQRTVSLNNGLRNFEKSPCRVRQKSEKQPRRTISSDIRLFSHVKTQAAEWNQNERVERRKERGTVATRKRERPTLGRLVAQFRRRTREKVHYTPAQPSSNVVFFFHSVSRVLVLVADVLPPSNHSRAPFSPSRFSVSLAWHPLLSGPFIAPTWHEHRLYKRARATTCFLLSPPCFGCNRHPCPFCNPLRAARPALFHTPFSLPVFLRVSPLAPPRPPTHTVVLHRCHSSMLALPRSCTRIYSRIRASITVASFEFKKDGRDIFWL